jgi:hypothetical protein
MDAQLTMSGMTPVRMEGPGDQRREYKGGILVSLGCSSGEGLP